MIHRSCSQQISTLQSQLAAALARAEAADKRITEIADSIGAYRYWRTNDDVMMYSCRFCPSSREAVGAEGPHQHHRVCVLNPDYEAGMQAARDERAALVAAAPGDSVSDSDTSARLAVERAAWALCCHRIIPEVHDGFVDRGCANDRLYRGTDER
jgi:hypothetical protein